MLQEKIRLNANQFYSKHGLPSRKDEAWHYTSLKNFNPEAFSTSPTAPYRKGKEPDLRQLLKDKLPTECHKLVFVNGVLISELSDINTMGSGLQIKRGFTQSAVRSSRKQRTEVCGVEQDVFEALNSARSTSALSLRLKANCSLSKPLALVSIVTEAKLATYQKVFLHLEAGAKLCLVEVNEGSSENYFQNSMTEVVLDPSSSLEYIRLQEDSPTATNIGRARFFVNAGAQLNCLTLGLGAKLARHNLEIFVKGLQASANSYGLYLVSGEQHHDHHLLIDHVVGSCETVQHYKGVLDGNSKAVFDGKVRIRKDAQKASSQQLNNNLVLSQSAEADSKPQLEIAADDVKATHGSTVGQLLQDELFYFQSRGISKVQAEEMLSVGFLEDLVLKIKNENLKSWLQGRVQSSYRRMRSL